MSSSSRTLLAPALALGLTVALATPAVAAGTKVADPAGDGPKHADIRSAKLTASGSKLVAKVKIPRLGKRGTVGIVFSQRSEDFDDYEDYALVTRTKSGKLSTSAFVSSFAVENYYEVECAVTASWNLKRDKVTITVGTASGACYLDPSLPVVARVATAKRGSDLYADFAPQDDTEPVDVPIG